MTAPVTSNTWFTVPQNEQAKIRLFCFPYAGGTNTIYRTWGKALGPSIAVCPAHLPGRERRLTEKPYTSAQAVVEAAAEAITPYLDQPFAFFGHSMGALISFELARHLRRLNLPGPKHLFLSGRGAPHFGKREKITYNLPPDEFAEELRRLNGTPREVLEHQELMELMIPLLRADFEVCETYNYNAAEPALDCPITAFGGLYDETVTSEMVQAWRDHTTSKFRLCMMPGDHFFIHSAQDRILSILLQELHINH